MYVRFLALVLVFLMLSSMFPVYGFTPPSFQDLIYNDNVGSWRYWFVILNDDLGGTSSLDVVQERVVKVIESLGGRVIHRHWLINAVSLEASPDVVSRLTSLGYRVTPSMVFKQQIVWSPVKGDFEPLDSIGVDTIGARRLHELGITGAGVRVAIIDTGVENLHPWLMRGGRSVVAWEVDATGTGIVDYCGKRIDHHEGGSHGTHVAGIVAGQHPRTLGVAPGALIYDIIVFREEIYCYGAYAHDIVRGIELALLGPDGSPNTGDEADVLNLSLGASTLPWWMVAIRSDMIAEPTVIALERAASMDKIVVVAAGNDAGHMTLNLICAAQNIICAGSSNQLGTGYRGDDRISWLSSRGPMPWYDVGPTVVAPGENIYSTIPTPINPQEPARIASGTSLAAPHVSGAVALLVEHYRRLGRVLTVDMAIRLLVHSSTTIKTFEGIDLAGAHEAGAGLIDVYNAAFPDLLVNVNGSYILSVLGVGDSVNLKLTAHNIGTSPITADIRIWFDDTFRHPSEGYEHVATISPGRITIPPGGRAEATITIDVRKLPPGLYGGYVDLVVGDRSYRVVLSLLVPAKLTREEFTAKAQVELLMARFAWWADWDMAAFYVDSPFKEIVTIRVETASPVAVTAAVFDPEANRALAAFLTSGSPGYIFTKPGLYIVLLRSNPIWGLTYFGYGEDIWVRVVLEAPLFEETASTFKSQLLDLQSQLSTLAGRVSSLELKISDLELRLKSLESRVSDVEARLSTIQSRVSDLESRVNTISKELSSLQTQVRGLSESLNNVTSRLTSLEAYARVLASNITRLDLSLAKLEARVGAVEGEVAGVKAALEGLKKNLEALRGELLEAVGRLRLEINSTKKDLQGLALRLNETAGELKALIEAGEARTAKILGEQAKQVEGLMQSVKLLSTTLDKLESNLKEVEKTTSLKLELLGTKMADQEAEIRKVEGNVRTLRENLDRTSGELVEARRALEDMIVREASKAQETGARGFTVGLVALALGLVALTIAGYTILMLRRTT